VATSTEAISSVKAWLMDHRPELEDIDMDLDLIENRVIDSLSFMDFVFFLEELTGRELNVEAGTIKTFRTLRSIEESIIQVG
jgi:acyl carrier protein